MLRAAPIALIGLGFAAAVALALAPESPRPKEADAVAVAPAEQAAAPRAAPAPVSPGPAPVAVDLRPAVEPGQEPPLEAVDSKVRDVTPPGVTPGPRVTGALIRIAPRPQPEEPPPVAPARSERLVRPLVAAAGVVVSGGREIRLAGIQAPGPEATCGEGASAWPCGRMARAALRRFVRARSVECEVPAGADGIPDPAFCRVGGRDLSEWLVEQGWAKRDGESYGEVEAAAREARLGLWADGRPGAQPEELAARGRASAPDRARAIKARVSGMP